MGGRVMIDGDWRPATEITPLLDRIYKRDKDGKFSSGGGGGVDHHTAEGYAEAYPDVLGESGFGDGGFVRSFETGDLQVGFKRKDGSVDVLADLSADDARSLGDTFEWADSYDVAGRGDRGPDPASGLVDWKSAGDSGFVVGRRPDGGFAMHADDGRGISLTQSEATQFMDALSTQIDAAMEG